MLDRLYCTLHRSLDAGGHEVCEAAILVAYRIRTNPYHRIRCKLIPLGEALKVADA